MVILAVSPKKGIYKFNFKDKKQADIKVGVHVQNWLSSLWEWWLEWPLQTPLFTYPSINTL